MTPDGVFSIANATAAIAWVPLILAPRRHWATTISGAIVPSLLAVAYVAIVATVWGRADGSFATLDGVAALFKEPWMLLAGWLHYLAFDLLVGTWEAHDARARGVPHLLLALCLILTFLFGPAGWLLYLGVRVRQSRP